MGWPFNFVFNLVQGEVWEGGGIPRTSFNDNCISIMQSYDVVYILRERNPIRKCFLCSPNITSGKHCWLDLFLISRAQISNVTVRGFRPGVQSGHSFVSSSIQASAMKRGPAYWKCNDSFLYDSVFITNIIDLINGENYNSKRSDPLQHWKLIKY